MKRKSPQIKWVTLTYRHYRTTIKRRVRRGLLTPRLASALSQVIERVILQHLHFLEDLPILDDELELSIAQQLDGGHFVFSDVPYQFCKLVSENSKDPPRLTIVRTEELSYSVSNLNLGAEKSSTQEEDSVVPEP